MDHFRTLTWLLILTFSLQLALTEDECEALKGATLRTMGSPLKPFLMLDEIGQISGVNAEIFQILAQKLGFSFTFEPTKSSGMKLVNGDWTGTVAKVKSGMADVGIDTLTINVGRNEAVKFTNPTNFLSNLILTKKPKVFDHRFKVLLPFPPEMWILVILAILSSVIVLYIVAKTRKDRVCTISRLGLEFLGLILAQNYQDCIRLRLTSTKLKFLLIIWIAFSSLLIYSYNCTLLKNLMTIEYEMPINSAEDLVRAEKDLVRGGHQFSSFQTSPNPSHKKLFEETMKNNRFYNLENGDVPRNITKLIEAEGAAIVLDEFTLNEFVTNAAESLGHNPFWRANERIGFINRGFVVQKSSKLDKCFNPILRQLLDSGIIAKIIERNTSPINVNQMDQEQKQIPINLQQIQFVFWLFLAGILTSGLVILWELRMSLNRLTLSKFISV